MYILCFGEYPLDHIKDDFTVDLELTPTFEQVPNEAKDLLNQLLCMEKENRISASEALRHEYFNLNLIEEEDACQSISRVIDDFEQQQQLENNAISDFTDQTPPQNRDGKDQNKEENKKP